MPNLLERLFRGQIKKAVENKFNNAFYGTVGEQYTAYDTNADTYLNSGYLYNPTVFSIVNQRCAKAMAIPFDVKRIKDNKAKNNLDKLRQSTKHIFKGRQEITKRNLETKAFDEEILDFPMLVPNPNQSWGDIISLYETFMAVTGNCYIYMVKGDISTEPLQVYVLPSHLVQIVLKKDADMMGTENPISGYILTEGNKYIEFDADEVLHIKKPNPEYGQNGEHLYGLSPLRAALRNIQSSNEAIDNNNRTLLNSGAFGFIHGKSIPLNQDQANELKTRMQEMRNDTSALGQIAGASAEMAFTRISLTTDELKPFDYLKYDEKQICNVLGWDNLLLNNDEGAKYDNVELAEQRVVVNTLIPSLKLLEECLTNDFLPLFKGYENTVFEFDYSQLPEMQQDIAMMVGWLIPLVNNGVINRDEIRDSIGWQKLGGSMEAFTVPQDLITLEEAINMDFRLNEQTNIPE